MADRTSIEWCDATFNPWIGCTRVSPGCDNCYAAAQDKFRGWTPEGWGGPRRRTSTWGDPKKWNRTPFFACPDCGWRGEFTPDGKDSYFPCPTCRKAELEPARRRVFCASLADVFDNQVFIGWFLDFLDLCRCTPNLDKLLLTKRIGNARKRLEDVAELLATSYFRPDGEWPSERRSALLQWLTSWLTGTPPPDVWLGATIVNQEEADRDIPKLLATPARVRFLSMEPLLGLVDLEYPEGVYGAGPRMCCSGFECGCMGKPIDPPLIWGINWIITGGESGPGARPMFADWARGLRDQCAAAGVAFMFKQWGEWAPGSNFPDHIPSGTSCHLGDPDEDPGEDQRMWKVGKKAAGRLLDGVTHDGFPEVA